MSHTYSQNLLHIVFTSKDRRKVIPPELLAQLWSYIAGICNNHEMTALAIGGTVNHVHILLRVPAKLAVAKAVALLKANSSKWIGEHVRTFSRQEGYGAFSVGASNADAVVRYIQNQPAHHRKISFEDEFRAMLRKHGVEYDPKFLFG